LIISRAPRFLPMGTSKPIQWIQGGWLLAVSVLVIAATIWLARRWAT
jgi:hypothetical protein